jgi:hypothetical protein
MRPTGEALRALHDTGAHPAIIEDLFATDRFQAVLAEDAHHAGTHQPGHDYRVDVEQLASVALLAMLQPPTAVEIATAADIAALHGSHAA